MKIIKTIGLIILLLVNIYLFFISNQYLIDYIDEPESPETFDKAIHIANCVIWGISLFLQILLFSFSMNWFIGVWDKK